MKIPRCSNCGIIKDSEQFYKRFDYKDGLDYLCKECRRTYNRQCGSKRHRLEHKFMRLAKAYLLVNGLVYCTYCSTWKEPSEFYMRSGTSKLRSHCAKCVTFINAIVEVQKTPEDHEAKLAHRRTWYADNIAREQERYNAWRLEHAEEHRERQRIRRARKLGTEIESINILKVFERDNWICQDLSCLQPVDSKLEWPDPKSKSLDHIIPLSTGGSHTYDNVQLMHLQCNIRKGPHRSKR